MGNNNNRFIETTIMDEVDNPWSCLLVSGEPDSNKMSNFFENLISKIKSIQYPLLCIGDWNCI